MAARQRASFDKIQRERARREKQAAKRARRQGKPLPGDPVPLEDSNDQASAGETPAVEPVEPVEPVEDPDISPER